MAWDKLKPLIGTDLNASHPEILANWAAIEAVLGTLITNDPQDALPVELKNLVQAEIQQVANLGDITVSYAQWGHLGAMNQGVATSNNVEFASIKGKGYHSHTQSIADDAAYSYNPASTWRFFFFAIGNDNQYYVGVCHAYATSIEIHNSGFTHLDGVLSGTTGVDGHLSIGVNNGTIYVENRVGASRSIGLVVIGTD